MSDGLELLKPFLPGLEDVLEDPEVSEIMINGPHNVWIEGHGKLYYHDAPLLTDAALQRAAIHIARPLGLDPASAPIVDARLNDGSRVAICVPPASPKGAITVRRFGKRAFSAADLVEQGALPLNVKETAERMLYTRRNILVSGGTGSGKTTLLNALIELLPDDERIVAIEDTLELRIEHSNCVRFEARGLSNGAVTIRDLVRHALRHRPDHIVVGEVRCGEGDPELVEALRRRVLRYEALGHVSRKEAAKKLREKLRTADVPREAPITFEELAREWVRSILPMYKYSTRKTHCHILNKHLLPMFGTLELTQLTRQRVQGFIAGLNRTGYAPHSIHHYHEVLSAVLRTAVSWNHISDNPAQGVSLPKLAPKRPKAVLTPKQAADLLLELPLKTRTMVALAILSGLRRGELLALRWKAVDESTASIRVSEAVYEGHFDSPKTAAGNRTVPLSEHMLELLLDWKARARRTDPEDLVFGTRNGTPVSSNNLIRRQIQPACEKLGLPHSTWLTFRRTFSSWSHQSGIPDKVIAELMGHANVYTTLNVYTQVMDESRRTAAGKIGSTLFSIVQFPGRSSQQQPVREMAKLIE